MWRGVADQHTDVLVLGLDSVALVSQGLVADSWKLRRQTMLYLGALERDCD